MRTTRSERGNSLIVTIVVVAVLSLVALGLVRRSTAVLESSGAKRRYDGAVSCADGARELVMSQFRTFGVNPTNIRLNTVVGDRRYMTGHYDATVAAATVAPVAGTVGTASENAFDLANRTVAQKLGGQLYSITVVCRDRDTPSLQSEVEFLVRFGI